MGSNAGHILEYALFIYNFLIILLFTVNATAFLILYKKMRKAFFLLIFALFVTYIFYDLLLFMADYIESFNRYYGQSLIRHPIIVTSLVMAISAFYGLITIKLVKDKIRIFDIAAYAFFAAGLLVTPLFDVSEANLFLYFTLIQFIFYYWAARGLVGTQKTTPNTGAVKNFRTFIFVALIINTLVVVEDYIVIFNYDVVRPVNPVIHNRNFSDDLLRIFIGISGLIWARRLLMGKRYFSDELGLMSAKEVSQLKKQTLALRFDQFCKIHGFTRREKEITSCIFERMSNREIAGHFYITISTVKNHIHSIFQKTGVSRRSLLTQKLQAHLDKNNAL